MGTTYEVKNSGEILLKKFSANPTPAEGMVIYNCTDKKLRFYNGTAWTDTGGGSFYTNPSDYVVYDDFTCATGCPWLATKWVCTHGGNLGAGTKCISSNRGFFIQNIGGGGSGGDSDDYITSCAIPAGRSIYMEMSTMQTGGQSASGFVSHYIGNTTDGFHQIWNASFSSNGQSWTNCLAHFANYLGSNCYELFGGGVSLCCVSLPNGAQFRLRHCISTPSSCSMNMTASYDNVRYSCS